MHTGINVAGAAALGVLGCLAAAGACAAVAGDCFTAASRRYGLDAGLLRAVASAESDLRPDAVNRSHVERTGTVDIGLMQVNSSWLPRLASYGIGERDLREPCTNVAVGAWILAQSFMRHGNQWAAVGAYNAACIQLKGEDCTRQRARYAWRVYRRLAPTTGGGAPMSAAGSATVNMVAPASGDRVPASARLVKVSLGGDRP